MTTALVKLKSITARFPVVIGILIIATSRFAYAQDEKGSGQTGSAEEKTAPFAAALEHWKSSVQFACDCQWRQGVSFSRESAFKGEFHRANTASKGKIAFDGARGYMRVRSIVEGPISYHKETGTQGHRSHEVIGSAKHSLHFRPFEQRVDNKLLGGNAVYALTSISQGVRTISVNYPNLIYFNGAASENLQRFVSKDRDDYGMEKVFVERPDEKRTTIKFTYPKMGYTAKLTFRMDSRIPVLEKIDGRTVWMDYRDRGIIEVTEFEKMDDGLLLPRELRQTSGPVRVVGDERDAYMGRIWRATSKFREPVKEDFQLTLENKDVKYLGPESFIFKGEDGKRTIDFVSQNDAEYWRRKMRGTNTEMQRFQDLEHSNSSPSWTFYIFSFLALLMLCFFVARRYQKTTGKK